MVDKGGQMGEAVLLLCSALAVRSTLGLSITHPSLTSIPYSTWNPPIGSQIRQDPQEERTHIPTMSYDESQRRKFIEEPQLEHLSEETLKNPPKQRTVQQQEKQDKLIAQERREAGIDTARSRSSSRRERRKRIKQAFEDGSYMKTGSLEALEEADANGDLSAMRPFERIGPDSTSMDGPVTMARALRGEIPVRGSNPKQPYYMTPEPQKGVRCASLPIHKRATVLT